MRQETTSENEFYLCCRQRCLVNNPTSTLNPLPELFLSNIALNSIAHLTPIKGLPNSSPPTAIHCALFPFIPVPNKIMGPTPGYLTFSPSTSTTRSILVEPPGRIPEPSERSQEPLERIQEPSERIQEPSERSQEPPERGLAQEDSEWSKKKIDQIAELRRTVTPWPEVGEKVGLSANDSFKMWEDYKSRQRKARVVPEHVPSRQGLPWERSEDEKLLRLYDAGIGWDKIIPCMEGRSRTASQSRYSRLRGGSEKTTNGLNNGES